MARDVAAELSRAVTEWTLPGEVSAADWRPAFLTLLRNSANVRLACYAAGVTKSWAYQCREREPEFRSAWDEALDDACDLLQAHAWMAALRGDTEMTKWLLARHRPEQYADRVRVDLTATIRREAERLASDLGVDADELIREAERIARGGR